MGNEFETILDDGYVEFRLRECPFLEKVRYLSYLVELDHTFVEISPLK